MSELILRPEIASDRDAIHRITEVAFRPMEYAGGDEQDVIVRLRRSHGLTLSLVAIDNSELVGQVTFSPASNTDGTQPWFALGPVSVLPERQGAGIGGRLIEEGLARISALGALGCILTGNPRHYQRFGFVVTPDLAPANEPKEYFMLKQLGGTQPTGSFSFHAAFYGEP